MSQHLGLSELAQFAEGTLPEPRAERAREHIAQCRSCMAEYVDAVRYRAAWLADAEAFQLDGEFRELAGAKVRPGGASPGHRRRRRRARAIVFLAAAAGIVIGFATIRPSDPSPTLGFALDPAVLEATSRSSERGLVLPGAEHDADRVRPELRSGPSTTSSQLDEELRKAISRYEQGARDAGSGARVVAALLAGGEIETARDYARESLGRFPNAIPLLVFAADADYRANDLAGAEALLRRALHVAPHDPMVALDLGLVLRRLGRSAEARELLARAAGSRVASLAARASRELAAS
jgi:tetratricopeptide (TPR) repeat protein